MDGDRYVLGFAPALRFLQSQTLCRLYNSPSNERSTLCICMQKDDIRTLKICSPCQSSAAKITQHPPKVSGSSECQRWTLYEVRINQSEFASVETEPTIKVIRKVNQGHI